jgi:GT2 family glycosyltransferase
MTEQRALNTVVVAYHQPALLSECLTALGNASPITVVDNSSDNEIRSVSLAHGARYIDPGRNLGFGAGVNLALAELHDELSDVLLLNPDARIDPKSVDSLRALLLEGNSEAIGGLSPRLVGPDGEQRVMWPFPSPRGAWLEALGWGRLNRSADFAVGAVLLLRGETLRDVGGFDERFFLYAEETDWQRRAVDLGWRFDIAPDVEAWHVGGATSDSSDLREVLFHAATETYVRKWFLSAGWASYRSAAIVGAAARWLLKRGPDSESARRRLILYIHGPRRVKAQWDDRQ